MNTSTQMPRTAPAPRRPALCAAQRARRRRSRSTAAAQQATHPGNLIIERDDHAARCVRPGTEERGPDRRAGPDLPDRRLRSARSARSATRSRPEQRARHQRRHRQRLHAGAGRRERASTHMLAGNGNGNNVPVRRAAAGLGGAGGIGSTITQTVTGALAPLGAALGAHRNERRRRAPAMNTLPSRQPAAAPPDRPRRCSAARASRRHAQTLPTRRRCSR